MTGCARGVKSYGLTHGGGEKRKTSHGRTRPEAECGKLFIRQM